jgi:hypothetical protein
MSKELILPTLQELTATDSVQRLYENDKLNHYLNQDPPAKWVKIHPYVANHKYLPIDKIELLLKKVLADYRIEILNQGTAFNGVWVTCRVHFKHRIESAIWQHHDGIGACQMQTSKGTSPAQLENINNGALSMAFPIAKTLAIKDACDHFGRLFGSDLNRKDIIPFAEPQQTGVVSNLDPELQENIDLCTDIDGLDKYIWQVTSADKTLNKNWAFRKACDEAREKLKPKN